MTTQFSAICERGLLRPTQPIALTEGEEVDVVIQPRKPKPGTRRRRPFQNAAPSGLGDSGERTSPQELDATLNGLQFLTDQELIKATKPTPTRKISRELSTLLEQSRVRKLTTDERQRQQVLLDALDCFILIRAQALVLLKQRGCDVSGLLKA